MKGYQLIVFNFFRNIFWRFCYSSRITLPAIHRIGFSSRLECLNDSRIGIGHNVSTESNVLIQALHTGLLTIGQRTYFNRGCMISCKNRIDIGENVIFGPNVKIYDNDHFFDKTGVDIGRDRVGTISIGDGSWIAANVVILRDTKIGRGCVIGAGTVVKGEIPDYSLVTSQRELIIQSLK